MARRKRPRNPEEALAHARIEAAAHKGRRGTARRLAVAEQAYAARVVGVESLGRVPLTTHVTRPSTTDLNDAEAA